MRRRKKIFVGTSIVVLLLCFAIFAAHAKPGIKPYDDSRTKQKKELTSLNYVSPRLQDNQEYRGRSELDETVWSEDFEVLGPEGVICCNGWSPRYLIFPTAGTRSCLSIFA